ncbi:MAG: hypothetical protein HY909_12900 [Deltaproteobacteria bacterium]|nr:hypothetical protein [Deltaproteobacteria bacterium]
MDHGVALEWAVRALVSLGDPRGAEHILRVLENPKVTVWFGEAVEALRRLGGPQHLERVRALQRSLHEGKGSYRDPAALDAILREWTQALRSRPPA